jgi:hypothetical protein
MKNKCSMFPEKIHVRTYPHWRNIILKTYHDSLAISTVPTHNKYHSYKYPLILFLNYLHWKVEKWRQWNWRKSCRQKGSLPFKTIPAKTFKNGSECHFAWHWVSMSASKLPTVKMSTKWLKMSTSSEGSFLKGFSRLGEKLAPTQVLKNWPLTPPVSPPQGLGAPKGVRCPRRG